MKKKKENIGRYRENYIYGHLKYLILCHMNSIIRLKINIIISKVRKFLSFVWTFRNLSVSVCFFEHFRLRMYLYYTRHFTTDRVSCRYIWLITTDFYNDPDKGLFDLQELWDTFLFSPVNTLQYLIKNIPDNYRFSRICYNLTPGKLRCAQKPRDDRYSRNIFLFFNTLFHRYRWMLKL